MFQVLLLVLYLVVASNAQDVQRVIFDECGCESGEFRSTGLNFITERFTTASDRCGSLGSDGFATNPGLRVPIDRTLTLPASVTDARSWGIAYGFSSKPEPGTAVTLATINPSNRAPFSFVLGADTATIIEIGTNRILRSLELLEDLDSFRILFGFRDSKPTIIASGTAAILIGPGVVIDPPPLGGATVALFGSNSAIVKDVQIVRDGLFGSELNRVFVLPVPIPIPSLVRRRVDNGFVGFLNSEVEIDLKRLLPFNTNTDNLIWRITSGPGSLGSISNFNDRAGTFTFLPAVNFLGQVPISAEYGFRGQTCRKPFDFNIFVSGFNGALTLQQVIFDQCSCQNSEFSSNGPQFVEGRLRMTTNDCGPRGANGFPLQGGLRVPLQPLTIPAETTSADWGILFGFDRRPTGRVTLATLTRASGGSPIRLELDGGSVSMSGLLSAQSFGDFFGDAPYRVFFGFQRNVPIIVEGNANTALPAILDGPIAPLGEMSIVVSGSSNAIIKDMIVAVNIGAGVNIASDLVQRPVPQDIPAVNPSALTLPVAQGITSLDIDMSQAIVETDTEDLIWRISEQNEFGEYRNLNSDTGSFTFTPSAQFFRAPRRTFLAEVGLEANQCRNRVEFRFAIAGFDEEESSNVFIFAGAGVGVVVVGVVWAMAVVTIRKRRQKKPNDEVVAAKEKLKEEEVRNDEWYERL